MFTFTVAKSITNLNENLTTNLSSIKGKKKKIEAVEKNFRTQISYIQYRETDKKFYITVFYSRQVKFH